jgi:hypothetical protein
MLINMYENAEYIIRDMIQTVVYRLRVSEWSG